MRGPAPTRREPRGDLRPAAASKPKYERYPVIRFHGLRASALIADPAVSCGGIAESVPHAVARRRMQQHEIPKRRRAIVSARDGQKPHGDRVPHPVGGEGANLRRMRRRTRTQDGRDCVTWKSQVLCCRTAGRTKVYRRARKRASPRLTSANGPRVGDEEALRSAFSCSCSPEARPSSRCRHPFAGITQAAASSAACPPSAQFGIVSHRQQGPQP